MPTLELMDLKHDAVLYAANEQPDGYAEYVLQSPVAIKCRWVDTEQEARDPQGNTISIIVTIATTREIPMGSVLVRGKLVSGEIPDPLSKPVQVTTRNINDDIKARNTRYEYGLSKYKDTVTVG